MKLYKNSIHCARTIIKTEGFIGLYNGLSASLARQLSYSTVRSALTTNNSLVIRTLTCKFQAASIKPVIS